ncbi:acyltransferase family protein [Photobacterium sp. SDRW27]|uniref:acyltransferase n=1 Tax=Photobacterium obscurum TaxID=2829490 RepID=UPI002242F50E|nr:acyltransferase family protein [Photobacterium obscurum]MCW8331264.1 acyltransferase family protein [Photobacterium obscurum]
MNNNRIASFEWGRLLALFAVIIIHAKPFANTPLFDEQPWLGMLLNQLGRFGVPLFFILAGYFIMPRLTSATNDTITRYSLPLIKVWAAWSVVYLLVPFNLRIVMEKGYLAERTGYWDFLLTNPLNTLFEGGLVHLWYIPGLLCGIVVIGLLCALKQQKLIVPVAVALYLYGLMAGSYQPIFGLESPIFTRNGPFFSTLMIAIGFEARRRNLQVATNKATAVMLFGMVLHLFEAKSLMASDVPFMNHDFLIGTPFWAAGLFFLLAAKPEFGNRPLTFMWSQKILGLYLCHLLVIIYLMNLAGMFGFEGVLKDLTMVPLSFFISLGLVSLIERTPLKSVLLR